jgi:hypothetical protein
VYISYGKQSNGSLLQYYSFTEPGNPNDVYAFDAVLGGTNVQVLSCIATRVGCDESQEHPGWICR